MNEITTNERGGKQSAIQGDTTEIPPIAALILSQVMGEGQRRYPRESDGTPNWYRIGWLSNLNHCQRHLELALLHRNRPHTNQQSIYAELSHMLARAAMTLERYVLEEMSIDLIREIFDPEVAEAVINLARETTTETGDF